MGIKNFCKLIQPISPPSNKPAFFDSVLVDCQSFLYTGIEYCLETDEVKNFDEIAESVWDQIKHLLNLFSSSDTFVLSFDGEGVPMKWATQRERRRQTSATPVSKKNFYRYVLFGNNKLTVHVQNYVLDKLKTGCSRSRIVLCGCNVPGEGEHKIFQIAEALKNCRNPVVVSVDQDVFIIALLRLKRYDTIQIYRYNQFYNINQLVSDHLPYPLKRFLPVSFLFGNDFIPTLIAITLINPPTIHNCLCMVDDPDDDPVTVISAFIVNMEKRIRFSRVEFVDHNLVVWFWITYLWILDYYTERRFPQQFLENHVYDAFDRNQLLTGLTDEKFSREMFRKAKENYDGRVTQSVPHAERYVFKDSEDLLTRLESYWVEPRNALCTVLRVSMPDRRKLKPGKSPNLGIETTP